jgi:hypothetical protein
MMRSVLPGELRGGQTVVVLARWLLVLVGLLVALWHPDALPQLRIEVGVILVVAIANFAMHAQILRRRPTLQLVAYAASLTDRVVITILVATQGGFASNTFVFYIPAVLAIALAFPTRKAAALSSIGVGLALLASSVGAMDAGQVLLRGICIAAVAVIGNAYWRLHRERIQPSARAAREDAADLFWGQVATFWARWALIGGGAVLVLSRAGTTTELAVGILPVVVVLVANFYLHGRYLVERPANASLTLLACGLDLAMLGLLFMTWSGPAGLGNPCYLFLYPIVFAVGLVFPPRISWPFAAASLGLYSLLMMLTGLNGPDDLKMLVVRLITLAATCGLGSLYWRIVRRQLRSQAHDETPVTLAWQAAVTS